MRQIRLIGRAASESKVSPGTLRIYEREGFLSPVRDSAGRRVYTAADVMAARRIAKERRAARGSGLRK